MKYTSDVEIPSLFSQLTEANEYYSCDTSNSSFLFVTSLLEMITKTYPSMTCYKYFEYILHVKTNDMREVTTPIQFLFSTLSFKRVEPNINSSAVIIQKKLRS